jgi:arsenate reductase
MGKFIMPITAYLYSNCSTCKKALQWLKKQNVHFEVKEITQTRPSLAELQRMQAYLGGDVKKLFNTSGLVYRELKLSERLPKMPLNDALMLLEQNGMLIKRPFLIGDHFGLVGFNEKQWEEKFARIMVK